MASVSMAPTTSIKNPGGGSSIAIERLPEEMNEMKIRDEKVNFLSPSLSRPPSILSLSIPPSVLSLSIPPSALSPPPLPSFSLSLPPSLSL